MAKGTWGGHDLGRGASGMRSTVKGKGSELVSPDTWLGPSSSESH